MDDSERKLMSDKIQQQKQKAVDLNLLKIVENLYDDLRTLPVTLKHNNSQWKETIADAHYTHDEYRLKKILFGMANGKEYIAVYQQKDTAIGYEVHDDYTVTRGYEFSLYVGEQKVLGVLFQCESDNNVPFSFYRALDISAFREGNWMQDLQELHRIKRTYSDALRAKIETEQIKKLQDDFGIE